MDYRDMTIWQLQQEQQKIADELKRRNSIFRVILDPTMPVDELEIRRELFMCGPHRLLVTNIGTE
jgi:hypothetical protein